MPYSHSSMWHKRVQQAASGAEAGERAFSWQIKVQVRVRVRVKLFLYMWVTVFIAALNVTNCLEIFIIIIVGDVAPLLVAAVAASIIII